MAAAPVDDGGRFFAYILARHKRTGLPKCEVLEFDPGNFLKRTRRITVRIRIAENISSKTKSSVLHLSYFHFKPRTLTLKPYNMDPKQALPESPAHFLHTPFHRRKFLLFTGAAAATAIAGIACKKDTTPVGENAVNLGSGDTGILNYAYALEQLEAAFYIKVMQSPFSGITATESEYLADIRDHEIAHRDFFKAALGSSAIQNLEVNFSSINFSSRDSVLGTAKAFEDLGVSAYNGAGKLFTSADYLTLAGKIVSVEARHAATIRDLIANGSFANGEVVDSNGLDKARTPAEVLAIAGAYLNTALNASNLPTS
jgi:hypothetical protein